MRRLSARQLTLSIVVTAAALGAAGCGGGGGSATTTTGAAASTNTTTGAAASTNTTAAAAAPTTTTAAATTTSATSPTTTAAAGTVPSGLGSLANVANCSALANIGSAFGQALSGAGGNAQKAAAVLQEFAAKTPAAIRPDFEIVAAAFAKIEGALKGQSLGSKGVPNAATIAKLAALGSQLNDPALAKAEAAIGVWASQNCKAG